MAHPSVAHYSSLPGFSFFAPGVHEGMYMFRPEEDLRFDDVDNLPGNVYGPENFQSWEVVS
jgi:hypothetical protein